MINPRTQFGFEQQKSCLYDLGNILAEHPLVQPGKIEWDGNHANIQAQNSQGTLLKDRIRSRRALVRSRQLLDTLLNFKLRVVSSLSEIDLVGCRILWTRKSPSPIQRFTS